MENKIINYKIKKMIGYGGQGMVFLIEHDKKKYALKITPGQKHENKKNLDIQLKFNKNIIEKYNDFFLKIYSYSLYDTCKKDVLKYIEQVDSDFRKRQLKKRYYNNASCLYIIYELVDGDIKDIIKSLEPKQIYSAIIQLAYCVHILEKNNYEHGDIANPGNIGYIKTDEKEIDILGYKVKTFGYRFKFIDYSDLSQQSDNVKSYSRFLNEFVYVFVFIFLIRTSFEYKLLEEEEYKRKMKDMKDILKEKNPEYFEKMKKYEISGTLAYFIYIYSYPNKFAKLVLGNKYKEYKKKYGKNHIKYAFPKMPLKEIRKIIKNKQNIKFIIRHFMKKINQN